MIQCSVFSLGFLVLSSILSLQPAIASSDTDAKTDNVSIEQVLEPGEVYRRFTYSDLDSTPAFETVIFPSGLIEGARASCLVVVLGGGSGGPETIGLGRMVDRFVERGSCLVVQPVAFYWSRSQRIVWPTHFVTVPDALVTTEEWVTNVVESMLGSEVDASGRVYLIGWSSSGPAVYSLLTKADFVAGAIVAGSVFDKRDVSQHTAIDDRRLFIYHSPFDSVVGIDNAYAARDYFNSVGLDVFIREHIYGHSGKDNYSMLVEGMSWIKK